MQKFERITISHESILDYPAARRILANLERYNLLPEGYDGEPEIADAVELSRQIAYNAQSRRAPENHPVGLGKKILHLTTQPGVFIKACPGSNNMLCCHYHIVNMVSNCPFDCTYCYLQTYLNQPLTTFYVNEDDIFEQVKALCARPPVKQLRVGTGEISDSLALDPISGFSERLASVMAGYDNVRLELKTKSKNVEHLLGIPKKDHMVISWSMNPPAIINAEEHGTARFDERLRAARLCVDHGFNVGFHFDPMIFTENWEAMYIDAAKQLLDTIPHGSIQWISMGALRYQPQLKPIALKRRPETDLFMDESIVGDDGKVRYLRSQRTEMFNTLNQFIKSYAPGVYTYLCMETMPVWEKALGRMPDRTF